MLLHPYTKPDTNLCSYITGIYHCSKFSCCVSWLSVEDVVNKSRTPVFRQTFTGRNSYILVTPWKQLPISTQSTSTRPQSLYIVTTATSTSLRLQTASVTTQCPPRILAVCLHDTLTQHAAVPDWRRLLSIENVRQTPQLSRLWSTVPHTVTGSGHDSLDHWRGHARILWISDDVRRGFSGSAHIQLWPDTGSWSYPVTPRVLDRLVGDPLPAGFHGCPYLTHSKTTNFK